MSLRVRGFVLSGACIAALSLSGCRDAPEPPASQPAPPETRTTPDDGVLVTAAVGRLAGRVAVRWRQAIVESTRELVASVPRAMRPAPIVVAPGPVALSDLGFGFNTDRSLVVTAHHGASWTFEEDTPEGIARIRIAMNRGALQLEGVRADALLDEGFERFVARWKALPGDVLDASQMPATATAPAWAWLSHRGEDGVRTDLALFVLDEPGRTADNARVVLVQIDGPGVAASRMRSALERTARTAPVAETWSSDGTLQRLDMPVRFALPPQWRREPDPVLAGRLAAVGALEADGHTAPRLTIRTSGEPVRSLQSALDALRSHVESRGGTLAEVETGRFRGRPAIRYAAQEAGARPLSRHGLLTLTDAGALLAIDVALTVGDPAEALEQALDGLTLSSQIGDPLDHPADEQRDRGIEGGQHGNERDRGADR